MIRGEKCELGFEKPSEHVKSPPLTLAERTAAGGTGSEHQGLPSGFKWPITFYLDLSSSATPRAALLCDASDAEERRAACSAHTCCSHQSGLLEGLWLQKSHSRHSQKEDPHPKAFS